MAIGILLPTIAFAGMAPTEMSPVCMAPPFPWQQPLLFAYISHIIESSDTPLARS